MKGHFKIRAVSSCRAELRRVGSALAYRHRPHAESARKQSAARDTSAVQGPSFWLGFGNGACGEANFRRSVPTLPPAVPLKCFLSLHPVSTASLPILSLVFCEQSLNFSRWGLLLIFLLIRFPPLATLFSQRPRQAVLGAASQ